MKGETSTWLRYADENLVVARMSLERGLLNACMQNAQQCVEKALKALVIEHGLEFKRTHSIQELARQLGAAGLDSGISEDECDLIDALYLPSKYPMAGVMPDLTTDTAIGEQCRDIAERVLAVARRQMV